MPTLYYAKGACSLAVHIVLEWIGEPYEAVEVDQHAPDYRRINPAAAVPALDYGGDHALTQAGAILEYLAQLHPAADLLDDGTPERAAELRRWSEFLTGDLHPAFFPFFAPFRYTISTEPDALRDVRAASLELVVSKLALLEAQLDDGDWIVGGKRTFVDAYATPMLAWAAAKLDGGLDRFPALKAHRARMLTDPAVTKAMADEGTPA